MKKRTLLGLMAGLPLTGVLSACGGNNSGSAKVRLLNASPGYSSLDLYVDEVEKCSGVAYGSVSNYANNDAGSFSTALTATGSSTELLTTSRTYSKDTSYTVVAYGWSGSLKSMMITEDQDSAVSGKMYFRVVNTAVDAGAVDVYLTASADELDASTPVQAGVSGGTSSSYGSVSSGTYRLRVTAVDDTSTLLLDVDNVSFDSEGVYNLVLTPTVGGALVGALVLKQGGNVTQYANTQARIRVVSALANGLSATVSLGNTPIVSDASPGDVQAYLTVASGTYDVNTLVAPSGSLGSLSVSLAAGSDTTLVITGTSLADAKVTVIVDDNRLPASGYYKIRLIHASNTEASYTMKLAVNASPLLTGVRFVPDQYSASSVAAYVSEKSVSNAVIAVTVPANGDTPYSTTASQGQSLESGGVYTIWVMDLVNGTPNGTLISER